MASSLPLAVPSAAAGVLCQRPFDLERYGVTCVVVNDSREALLNWARFVLRKLTPRVVGISGSSGKTTTKELTAAALSLRHAVFRNLGNYHDRYGLPIALGRLGPEHEVAVLELACDRLDEIRDLAALTRPQIGVVTTVNETHLAYLGSLEAIATETGRLVEALPPHFDPARRGRIEPGEQVEECRLARARSPHDGKKLAARDGEIHPVHRAHFMMGPLVMPAERVGLDPVLRRFHESGSRWR